MATEDVEAEIRAASRTRAGSEREAIARLSEDDAASSAGAATPPAVRASVSTSSSKPPPSSANGAGGGGAPKSSSSTSAAAVPASDIPTSFMQSLGAWWASSESESRESERRLLRRMPFFTDDEPEGEGEHGRQGAVGAEDAVVARIMRVPVGATTTTTTGQGQGSKGWLGGASAGSKSDRYINTLKFTTRAIERKVAETPLAAATTASAANASPRDAVVLLHGYGAGLGFFYLNWTTIARASAAQGMRSYALDWLGMGRSARPSPSELNAGKRASVEERVKKAERFFTDSLEQWRVREGVERMTLIGHSLGGYLSLAYALEYPVSVSGALQRTGEKDTGLTPNVAPAVRTASTASSYSPRPAFHTAQKIQPMGAPPTSSKNDRARNRRRRPLHLLRKTPRGSSPSLSKRRSMARQLPSTTFAVVPRQRTESPRCLRRRRLAVPRSRSRRPRHRRTTQTTATRRRRRLARYLIPKVHRDASAKRSLTSGTAACPPLA